MENNATNDPQRLSHQEFINSVNRKEIDFKIVGFGHEKLLFGAEKIIQRSIHYLHYAPILAIPILAYFKKDWWVLLGLLIYLITASFAGRKTVPFIQSFTLYCIVYWIIKGFSFHQNTTIFFFIATYTNVVIEMDRNLQRKWARQNLLLHKETYDHLVEHGNIEIHKINKLKNKLRIRIK